MSARPVRIWGRASAFNLQKALWGLAETGIAFERIDAGGAFGGLDAPEFRAMNPNGRIPVVDDGEAVVWESNAVIRYLAARYASGTLWPESPAARSEADRWMEWFQNNLYRPFMDLFWGLVRTPEAQRDWPRIEALVATCAGHYRLLDQHLATRPYLGGDRFTMGDIPAGTSLYRYFAMDIDRPDVPNVQRWYDRLRVRAPYQAHVMVPFDDLVGRLDF
ncbi:MAG: glutathione S-transferase [Ectothiorhodospiraceae bacterium]|nr:glutathione S-transferase [Chromatiales bacterium]MCP5154936.1 glutathione S-transferase [Ectothiorhodospiraceae bacterium]